VIVNAMLAGKQHIGYLGDMPAIVAPTKREVADLRIIANVGLSHDQCNVLFVRNDAPRFKTPKEAVAWLNGKTVATPNGSCADLFGRAVFDKEKRAAGSYLNQSLEVITSGFRAGKLDGAVIWEPTASRLVVEGLARRVATGNNFDEPDGAFLDIRADLVKQRPDVVKGEFGNFNGPAAAGRCSILCAVELRAEPHQSVHHHGYRRGDFPRRPAAGDEPYSHPSALRHRGRSAASAPVRRSVHGPARQRNQDRGPVAAP
jgi:hypothetical protein